MHWKSNIQFSLVRVSGFEGFHIDILDIIFYVCGYGSGGEGYFGVKRIGMAIGNPRKLP